ncbi:MAG: D-aminoacylase, partial [Acidobacteriota bacterium]
MSRLLFLLALPVLAQSPDFDLLITGGRIVDGAGNPWFFGDVGIVGDTVVYVGPATRKVGKKTLSAQGLTVAPGFIDTHSHGRRGVFDVPSAENQIRQGVTTIIEGPDGSSPYPIKAFLDRFSKVPATTNFGLLLGQGTVRERVIGLKDRKATPEEITRMEGMVRQAMLDGAFGLSTGLFYLPGA